MSEKGDSSDGDQDFKPGSYQIQVHVIEARDIKVDSPSPKVLVEVMDKTKATPTIKNSFSPFFDHVLFWEFPNVTLNDFEYGRINISLYDTNTALRSKVVGSFEFDVMNVYKSKNHEVYKTWIALTDPTDSKEGVQALVKVSIAVLGPGDDPVAHNEKDDEEGEEDTGAFLMPPRMKTEDHLLCLQIHCAEGLPKVDSFLQGGTIDPFVKVEFAGVEEHTHTITDNQNPIFDEELQLPVTLPTMTDRIVLTLMDKDKVGTNDTVATTMLRFSDIPECDEKDLKIPDKGAGHIPPKNALTRWITLYGPRGKLENKSAMVMRKGLSEGSTYLGRMLVTAWHMKHEGPKKDRVKISTVAAPADKAFVARINVMQGSQLPYDSELKVKLEWAGKHVATRAKKGKNGTTQWYEELPELEIRASAEKLPDVFLYLVHKDKHVAYVRRTVADIRKRCTLTLPTWTGLKEDSSLDALKHGTYPGDLLYTMEIAPADEVTPRSALMRPSFMPCTLHCYLYSAKDLPALDKREGTLDPYIVVSFAGARKKTKVLNNTRFPVWNTVLSIEADVIQPLKLAPAITCSVNDSDDTSADDLAGMFSVSASNVSETYDAPQWHTLAIEGQTVSGEVLIGFQLVPMTTTFTPPKSIVPKSEERVVEFTIIGMRNLAPYNYTRITKPYVVAELYGKRYKTKHSNKPSGKNPNFLECAIFRVPLPLDGAFAEPLILTVYDDRMFGTPVIATGAINLEPFFDHTAKHSSAFLGGHQTDEPEATEIQPAATMGGAAATGDDLEGQALLEVRSEDGEADSTGPAHIEEASDSDTDLEPTPKESTADAYDEDASAKFMEGRAALTCELEDTLKIKPFHEVPLFRHTSSKSHRPVGLIKGNVFILPPDADENMPRPFSHTEFQRPKHYIVRLYVIRGYNLTAKDTNGLSDPILEVSLGRKVVFDKESLRKETINPEFHCYYELDAILPGQSNLGIQVYDSDRTGYEKIGRTDIDLENYFFSEEWHSYEKKPLERRTLWSDLTPTPQGTLDLWVEILDPRLKSVLPPTDISPPPQIKFEMRVIVWKAEDIIPGDYIGDISDMYVTVDMTGKGYSERKDTDVHWRATKGKGSFNYRMIFDLTLPMKQPRLTISVWDQDIIGSNDALGEAIINPKFLQRTLIAAYRTKKSAWLRLKKKGDVTKQMAEWIPLRHPEKGKAGRVLIEIEVMPKEISSRKPAGEGRKDPNSNPYLPPPARMEWNLLRPDLILKKLIGPDLFARLKHGMICLVCCMLMGFLLYFVGQLASIIAVFT